LAGNVIYPWLQYPFVLGSDVAGHVIEVGDAVRRFKVGDRVLAHAVGSDKDRNTPAEGGFQRFTVVLEHMASPIPQDMAFEHAAVLPLGLSTSASVLFRRDMLSLQRPSDSRAKINKTVIVWGGATSIGCNAIQLAAAAGYRVITTAARENASHLRRLGAALVFDNRANAVIEDIIDSMSGLELAGILAIGAGAASRCVELTAKCRGNRAVVVVTPRIPMARIVKSRGKTLCLVGAMIQCSAANFLITLKARMRGVKSTFVCGSLQKESELNASIYEAFLPKALAEGRYQTAPEPLVIGHGLDSIDKALFFYKQGLSAKKIVVTL